METKNIRDRDITDSVVASTVITKRYLHFARTLAKSIRQHNPGSVFYVLLADRNDGYIDPAVEPFSLVTLDELPDQECIRQMSFYYSPREFCCGVRGLFYKYLYDFTPHQKWLFFDPDIMVYHSLRSIWDDLGQYALIICPHILSSVNPSDPIKIKFEQHLLTAGPYNGGFLGLRRCEEALRFIDWLSRRLRFYAHEAPHRGEVFDQRWYSYAPIFFKTVGFLTEPGANVAYWNLHERAMEFLPSGEVTVNGQPLLFFHFSGCDVQRVQRLSIYTGLYGREQEEKALRLLKEYALLNFANGYEAISQYPYSFKLFRSGQEILPEMRDIYCENIMKGIDQPKDPFGSYDYFATILKKRRAERIIKTVHEILGRVKQTLPRK